MSKTQSDCDQDRGGHDIRSSRQKRPRTGKGLAKMSLLAALLSISASVANANSLHPEALQNAAFHSLAPTMMPFSTGDNVAVPISTGVVPQVEFSTYHISKTSRHAIFSKVNTLTDFFPQLSTDAPGRMVAVEFYASPIAYGEKIAASSKEQAWGVAVSPPEAANQDTASCCLTATMTYKLSFGK